MIKLLELDQPRRGSLDGVPDMVWPKLLKKHLGENPDFTDIHTQVASLYTYIQQYISHSHTNTHKGACISCIDFDKNLSFYLLGRYVPDFWDHATGSAMSVPEDLFTALPLYSAVTYTGSQPSCSPVTSNINNMGGGYGYGQKCCTAEVLYIYIYILWPAA